jgi:hypothetical protein
MTGPATGPGRGRLARLLRYLPALTLLAVLTITATAEYELARTVLDLRPQIAWALPAAVDSYVLAALHTRRDVGAAVAVMAGALLASMGAHLTLANRGDQPLPPTLAAPLATAIMTVLVVVAWRVHVLIDTTTAPTPAPDTSGTTATDTGTGAPRPAGTAAAPPSTPTPASTPRVTSTPRVASAPAATGSGEVADKALPPSVRAGTPAERTAPGAPARSRASTATEEAAVVAGPTDAQILAAITGEPPSIRALRREHGIGQARATRLHRLAVDNRAAARRDDPATSDQNSQNASSTQRIQHPDEPFQESSQETHDHSPEKPTRESRAMTKDESHTGITDRVGQPKITKKSDDLALWSEFDRSGEAR